MKKWAFLFFNLFVSIISAQSFISDSIAITDNQISIHSKEIWQLENAGLISYDEIVSILIYQKQYGDIKDFKELLRANISVETIRVLQEYCFIPKKKISGNLSFRYDQDVFFRSQIRNEVIRLNLRKQSNQDLRKYLETEINGIKVVYGNILSPYKRPYYSGLLSEDRLKFYSNYSSSRHNVDGIFISKKLFNTELGIGKIGNEKHFLLKSQFGNVISDFRIKHDNVIAINGTVSYRIGSWYVSYNNEIENNVNKSSELQLSYIKTKRNIWMLDVDRKIEEYSLKLINYQRIGKLKMTNLLQYNNKNSIYCFWKNRLYFHKDRISMIVNFKASFNRQEFSLRTKLLLNSYSSLSIDIGAKKSMNSRVVGAGVSGKVHLNNIELESGFYRALGSDYLLFRSITLQKGGKNLRIIPETFVNRSILGFQRNHFQFGILLEATLYNQKGSFFLDYSF